MKRNQLVLCLCTSIAQQLPVDLEAKGEAFHKRVKHIQENSDFPYKLICNVDETPASFDTMPSKTIDNKGTKTTRVLSTRLERKQFIALLCCSAAGIFLPYLIFKGKTKSTERNNAT